MPPKAKISREMIVEAGLEVIRRNGHESLSVRSVAAELGCSTQPVMYHYKSVSELRADVYAAADELHTKYITAEDDTATKNNVLYITVERDRCHAEATFTSTPHYAKASYWLLHFLQHAGLDELYQKVRAPIQTEVASVSKNSPMVMVIGEGWDCGIQKLEKGGPCGRELDFIAQEMNREANTTLSKANSLQIADTAISLKTAIEKVREQIQNIE